MQEQEARTDRFDVARDEGLLRHVGDRSGETDGGVAGLRPRGKLGPTPFRGTVRYTNGVTGTLIYSANVMTARAPWDVQAHHAEDPRFPHDPTTDQLYADQKFESLPRPR